MVFITCLWKDKKEKIQEEILKYQVKKIYKMEALHTSKYSILFASDKCMYIIIQ